MRGRVKPGTAPVAMEHTGDLPAEQFFEATGDAFPLEVEELSGEELRQLRAATRKEEAGRVLEALRTLEGLSKLSSPGPKGTNRRPSSAIEAHRCRVHSRIASDLAVVGAALDETEQDGWQLAVDGKLKIEYRHRVSCYCSVLASCSPSCRCTNSLTTTEQPGTTVHGFRYTATLECAALHIVCMGREFDLIKTWNSYIKGTSLAL